MDEDSAINDVNLFLRKEGQQNRSRKLLYKQAELDPFPKLTNYGEKDKQWLQKLIDTLPDRKRRKSVMPRKTPLSKINFDTCFDLSSDSDTADREEEPPKLKKRFSSPKHASTKLDLDDLSDDESIEIHESEIRSEQRLTKPISNGPKRIASSRKKTEKKRQTPLPDNNKRSVKKSSHKQHLSRFKSSSKDQKLSPTPRKQRKCVVSKRLEFSNLGSDSDDDTDHNETSFHENTIKEQPEPEQPDAAFDETYVKHSHSHSRRASNNNNDANTIGVRDDRLSEVISTSKDKVVVDADSDEGMVPSHESTRQTPKPTRKHRSSLRQIKKKLQDMFKNQSDNENVEPVVESNSGLKKSIKRSKSEKKTRTPLTRESLSQRAFTDVKLTESNSGLKKSFKRSKSEKKTRTPLTRESLSQRVYTDVKLIGNNIKEKQQQQSSKKAKKSLEQKFSQNMPSVSSWVISQQKLNSTSSSVPVSPSVLLKTYNTTKTNSVLSVNASTQTSDKKPAKGRKIKSTLFEEDTEDDEYNYSSQADEEAPDIHLSFKEEVNEELPPESSSKNKRRKSLKKLSTILSRKTLTPNQDNYKTDASIRDTESLEHSQMLRRRTNTPKAEDYEPSECDQVDVEDVHESAISASYEEQLADENVFHPSNNSFVKVNKDKSNNSKTSESIAEQTSKSRLSKSNKKPTRTSLRQRTLSKETLSVAIDNTASSDTGTSSDENDITVVVNKDNQRNELKSTPSQKPKHYTEEVLQSGFRKQRTSIPLVQNFTKNATLNPIVRLEDISCIEKDNQLPTMHFDATTNSRKTKRKSSTPVKPLNRLSTRGQQVLETIPDEFASETSSVMDDNIQDDESQTKSQNHTHLLRGLDESSILPSGARRQRRPPLCRFGIPVISTCSAQVQLANGTLLNSADLFDQEWSYNIHANEKVLQSLYNKAEPNVTGKSWPSKKQRRERPKNAANNKINRPKNIKKQNPNPARMHNAATTSEFETTDEVSSDIGNEDREDYAAVSDTGELPQPHNKKNPSINKKTRPKNAKKHKPKKSKMHNVATTSEFETTGKASTGVGNDDREESTAVTDTGGMLHHPNEKNPSKNKTTPPKNTKTQKPKKSRTQNVATTSEFETTDKVSSDIGNADREDYAAVTDMGELLQPHHPPSPISRTPKHAKTGKHHATPAKDNTFSKPSSDVFCITKEELLAISQDESEFVVCDDKQTFSVPRDKMVLHLIQNGFVGVNGKSYKKKSPFFQTRPYNRGMNPGILVIKAGATKPRCITDLFTIFFCLSGRCRLTIENDFTIEVNKNDSFFLQQGKRYIIKNLDDKEPLCKFLCVRISQDHFVDQSSIEPLPIFTSARDVPDKIFEDEEVIVTGSSQPEFLDIDREKFTEASSCGFNVLSENKMFSLGQIILNPDCRKKKGRTTSWVIIYCMDGMVILTLNNTEAILLHNQSAIIPIHSIYSLYNYTKTIPCRVMFISIQNWHDYSFLKEQS